jgi:tetratricopeptide (TPR) repeat protein
MKKLNQKLLIGAATAFIVFAMFFAYQVSYAQNYKSQQESLVDSINRQTVLKLNNEVIQSLELKVNSMEKYVESSQKNLDLWLKLLSFILSVLIGFSVYSGLRTRELAKDELAEIRRIREGINREANDAEDRLKMVNDKIIQMEATIENTKKMENEMTLMLDGLANKEEIVLNSKQKKLLDTTISKTKEDLQKSGIESFKNLYFAKALKAQSDKKWDDAIRLLYSYIDLDENNAQAFYNRARAYLYSAVENQNSVGLFKKALDDINESIRLDSNFIYGYINRGYIYGQLGEDEKAISDYSEAIRHDPKIAVCYFNRGLAYKRLGKLGESEIDYIKAKELDPDIEKND